MGHSETRNRWQYWLVVAAVATLSTAQSVHGKCLSPSAETGITATTVYRCSEPAAPASERMTVIERGPSDLPWFAPEQPDTKTEATKVPTVSAPAPAPDEAPKVKVTKVNTAKVTAVKTAKVKAIKKRIVKKKVPEIAAKKSQDNVVVWTKKDMPLGTRIVNWLGL